MFKSLFSLIFICALTPSSLAAPQEVELTIRDLSWTNKTFISNQRDTVDQLIRQNLGTKINGDKADLHKLQRLIDKGVIARDDTPTLQALGVILGDVYVNENNHLHWQVLEDELGSSHVVCIKNTQHCLFPITMLSRRIEVGLNPSVEKTYQKGLDSIKGYLPKLPFSVSN